MGYIRPSEIVVCEIWCRGFEHVEFNAALLCAIGLAFPQANLLFLSEPEHGDMVRQRLQDVTDVSITYGRIAVPNRELSALRQFLTEIRACWRGICPTRGGPARALVFTSLKGGSLLAVKALMYSFGTSVLTLGIIHGELSNLLVTPPRRPWNRALSLRSALQWPNPRWLRLLVLGDSIKNEVVKLMPSRYDAWRAVELVCLSPDDLPKIHRNLSAERPIRFGFLGASSKGFEKFCYVAQTIKSEFANCEFEMVGFLGRNKPPENALKYVTGISEAPLAPKEYRRRLAGLTYCLGLDNPEHHRLAGSGTFIDSLSYAIPYIALRNSYLDYYFQVLGDVGYLCDNVHDMCACIRRILTEPPNERYTQQQANSAKGRSIFAPQQVAVKLKKILSETAESRL